MNKKELFSLMANTASEIPELNKNVEELEHFDEISEIQRNLEENINSSSNKSVPSNIKLHVNEMFSDITNGKFKEYLNKPPINSINSTSNFNKSSDVEFFTNSIKELKAKENLKNPNSELILIVNSIEKQLDDVKTAQCNLERLFSSLNKLKSRMNKIIVDPKLNENVIRDLAFEVSVKKVCDKINDLNKYIETKKKIIKLCKDQMANAQNLSERHMENELPAVISMLLRDFEIAIA